MDYIPLFETPIQAVQIDGTELLNAILAKQFVRESCSKSGIERINNGVCHSIPDLCTRPDPAIKDLMEVILDCVQMSLGEMAQRKETSMVSKYEFGLQAWATVMNKGDYTTPHDHAESHLSGVYYLDAGDADMTKHADSGLLAFLDPRGSLPPIPGLELFPSTFTVKPSTGVMVLFPGFLTHYVQAYCGNKPRVSVAFNVRMELLP